MIINLRYDAVERMVLGAIEDIQHMLGKSFF
jgi:hypothetical protein